MRLGFCEPSEYAVYADEDGYLTKVGHVELEPNRTWSWHSQGGASQYTEEMDHMKAAQLLVAHVVAYEG